MYALMDFDPDGIAIMSTYKYGSIALRHENASLQVPDLEWLGIKSADINSCPPPLTTREHMFQVPVEGSDSNHGADEEGLLCLTQRDRQKARKMLEWQGVRGEVEWMRELQTMLMLNIKFEIQLLCAKEGGLERWLDRKLADTLQ